MFPSFRTDSGMVEFASNGSVVTALMGSAADVTKPSGWLAANLYANFLPLRVLMATIGDGAACIAGQDRNRTLGLAATLPVSRMQITGGKLAAMLVQALVVLVAAALCVLVGPVFGLTLGLVPLLGATVGLTLLGLVFGTLAMFVGAVTGRRGVALGVSTAAALAAYLVATLAPVVHWLRPARYLSPFFYAIDDNQMQHGLPLSWFGVLAAMTVVFAAAAAVAFNRMDVH